VQWKNTTGSRPLLTSTSHLGDAEALLHVLRDGVEARDEQFRRLKAGQISPGEFKPKPPI
jgi:hypothetical protein